MPALQKRSDLINLEQYENLPEDSQIKVFDGIFWNLLNIIRLIFDANLESQFIKKTVEFVKWKTRS